MDLELIKTQSNIFNRLKNAYKNDRLSHAYLFYGEEGTGKLEMAYALACMLYCKNDCCFECEECKNILNNNHLNVKVINPLKDKKAIVKDQIEELQEEFSKTSLVDGPRIYIINGIDDAGPKVSNMLLKFIEEPQNKTQIVGIFLATELSNVLLTIKSRCNVIHFEPISLENMINLGVSKGYDAFDTFLVSKLSNNPDDIPIFIKNWELKEPVVSDIEGNVELIEKNDNGQLIKISNEIESKTYEIDSVYVLNVKEKTKIKVGTKLTKEVLDPRILLFEFLNLKTKAEAVRFYLKYKQHYSNKKNILTLIKWLIGIYEQSITLNVGLQLNEKYDKIINSIKDKDKLNILSFLLKLQTKLKYNVSAKNIFHELIVKMI